MDSQLLELYNGYKSSSLTKGVFYPKGIYDLTQSPELATIADYLVDNGHAVYVRHRVEMVPVQVKEVVSESKVESYGSQGTDVEFTSHATDLLAENGFTTEDVTPHFVAKGILKITKADAQDFLDELNG